MIIFSTFKSGDPRETVLGNQGSSNSNARIKIGTFSEVFETCDAKNIRTISVSFQASNNYVNSRTGHSITEM